MAMYLETLEPVIATALNILKNRPLADLYVRRDRMGDFRIRVQLESGQRYVITIREEYSCILGCMTPSTARAALVGQPTRAQPSRF